MYSNVPTIGIKVEGLFLKEVIMRKKVLLLVVVISFLAITAYSGTITIKSPRTGDVWYKGKTYTIKWDKSGQMNSRVKIRLYRGNMVILNITDSTENDGSFSWKVLTALPDGNYVVRVKTIDNKIFDDSDNFKILKEFSNISGINTRMKKMNLTKGSINKNFIKKLKFRKKVYYIKPEIERAYIRFRGEGKGELAGVLTEDTFVLKPFDTVMAGFASLAFNKDPVRKDGWVDVYRSTVYFNVSFLKGKGIVKRAVIHYKNRKSECAGITPCRKCGFKLYKIKDPNYINIFQCDPQISRIWDPGDLKDIVSEWINIANYGLLYVGETGDYSKIELNQACLIKYKISYLEVEME